MLRGTRKGITLIELLLVIALIGVIIPVVTSIFFVGNKSYSVSKDIGFIQQDLRLASIFTNKELRLTSDIQETAPVGGVYYGLKVYYDDSLKKTTIEIKEYQDGTNTETRKINGDYDLITIGNTNFGLISFSAVSTVNGQNYEITQSILLENMTNLKVNESFVYNKLDGSKIEFYFKKKVDEPDFYIKPPDDSGVMNKLTIGGSDIYYKKKDSAFTVNNNINGGTKPYSISHTVEVSEFTNIDVIIIDGNKIQITGISPKANSTSKTITLHITVTDKDGKIETKSITITTI